MKNTNSTFVPLEPIDADRYQRPDPSILFRIERKIHARKCEVFRSWTEEETFKRWIAPPNHQLVFCSVRSRDKSVWKVKSQSEGAICVEHILDCQTNLENNCLEFQYSMSQVPDTENSHPVHIMFELEEIQSPYNQEATKYTMDLHFHTAKLWRLTSSVDIHTFWIDATERMALLVERQNILSRS